MVSTVKLFFLFNMLILIASLVSFIISVIRGISNSYSAQQGDIWSGRHSTYVKFKNRRNPFKCYDDIESTILQDFYRLDCRNPFLRNISLRDLDAKVDVCELFNESHDGNENHTLFSRISREFQLFRQNITHSDIMNIEAACPECHHIQIIDGELFIVERRTAVNFQTRSRTMKAMLKQVTDTFRSIRNLEMFIHLRK
jgi:hypothetical protein